MASVQRRWLKIRVSLLPAAFIASTASCTPSDSDFVDAVRAHIAAGPVAACCTTGVAIDVACAKDAPTRCAFVNDAKVTLHSIERAGHGDVAMVDVDVVGPSGRGWCGYQVVRRSGLVVDGGACAAGSR